MFTGSLARRRVRRLGWAVPVFAALLVVRAAIPGPPPAAGVVDPVTYERLGEMVYGMTPVRLLDTRPAHTDDGQYVGLGALRDGNPLTLPIRARAGIPAEATGVLVNVTVTGTTGAGYLTVWPAGPAPSTSTLNFADADTVANLAFAALGADGAIRLQVSGADADVLLDVVAFTSDYPTL